MTEFVKLTRFNTGKPVWVAASAISVVTEATATDDGTDLVGSTQVEGTAVWAYVSESVEEVLQLLTNGRHVAEDK